MSVFKSQFSRAINVIKSDNANIPSPTLITTGTNTSISASKLICSSATFLTNNVSVGDIVYNTTDGTAATVITADSQTQLTLNADIFTAISKAFVVYQASAQTGLGNTGATLYIGGAGTLNVVTIGGDSLLISGLTAGSILPIQVLQVKSGGTATLITALW